MIKVKVCICKCCAHEWVSRIDPQRCPWCQSKKWDEGKVEYPQTCVQCRKKWKSRKVLPYQCPGCHSRQWKEDGGSKEYTYDYFPDGGIKQRAIKCAACGMPYPALAGMKTQRCPHCGQAVGGRGTHIIVRQGSGENITGEVATRVSAEPVENVE
jgi:Zn finger protein HypA/HybF involved in hydrogenase expression